MKNLILAGFVALTSTLNSQTTLVAGKPHPVSNVPSEVKTSFVKENPDTEAKWKSQDTNFRAEYIDASNIPHVRVYDRSGNMVYRDDVMESFPAPILQYYTTKYPGEGFITWSRIDAKGTLSYYAYRNSEMLWFDKDGKFQAPRKNKSRFADSISVVQPPENN